MAPDPIGQEEANHSTVPIITGHKISLSVHYDSQDVSTGRKEGIITPVEEKVVKTGAYQRNFGEQKFTHIDSVVLRSTEETDREVSLPSSLHSSSSLTGARPETPETNSAHSEPESDRTPSTKGAFTNHVTKPGPILDEEYCHGPDQIIPTDLIKTWLPSAAVTLNLGNDGFDGLKPISVPTLLRQAATEFPANPALSVKRNGVWQHHTYREYYEAVRTVAKAFIKLGLERFHGVCILGFNSPEWFIADIASIFAGGFAAGIYTTNSPEACQHCASNCQAQIWVVEDHKQLEKVLQIKGNLPHLKTIIQYIGKPSVEGVLSWEEVLEIGKRESDHELDWRLKRLGVNQCCTLIYTSGTTGAPKGVMLSHDNMTWTGQVNGINIEATPGKEMFVSYLPLSHIAAQMADIYVCMAFAASVVFAQPDALKGTLINTLKEVNPTRFIGVPRVWEKMHEKMMAVGSKTTGIKRSIATWAKAIGTEVSRRKQQQNYVKPWGYTVANAIVYKKVKAALGFDRCVLFLCGAAPIGPDVVRYFHSLDICMTEIYGMSESSGPHCSGLVNAFKIGSVGRTVPGCHTKIVNPSQEGTGEICMGGRNVCMGYLRMEDKTHEAVDDEGWLHSGDIGRIDEDGYLYITGRLKELIITAGGENIPPILIEDQLKSELPCISNAMLIGDRRKFLSILLTLKTNMDEEGEPTDALTPACIEWCQSGGSTALTVQDVLTPDAAVMRSIQEGIDRVNSKASSNAQKIQKWTILPKDFTISGDELGPTLKLKRPVVAKKYSETIEKFYA